MTKAKNEKRHEGSGTRAEGTPGGADLPRAAAEEEDAAVSEPTPVPAEAKEEEAQVPREKWLRALADLDNLRKRTSRQIAKSVQNERRTILSAFLEVVDNLDRGLKAHENEENEWVEGMKALRRQMLDVLKQFGVEPFESMDKPFDPHRHEAVAHARVPDRPEGTIVEVVRQGYAFDDETLLRPARVIVSGQE
ncbi:MAG TPA: nucleotide exchange factor GrpE [Sumerlaeia bacterium]|nr:nucleotide exchange factor GrpE [Sumerlaeia bacterium]